MCKVIVWCYLEYELSSLLLLGLREAPPTNICKLCINFYGQSCLYFRLSFLNYFIAPLTFSLVHPPPFPVSKYSIYRQHVWLGGRVGFWVLLETIFCRSIFWTTIFCVWPDSKPTKLLYHPKQKPRGEGPQTDKHLPQSSLTGKFFKMTTFCIAFYQSNLSTIDSICLLLVMSEVADSMGEVHNAQLHNHIRVHLNKRPLSTLATLWKL